MSETDRGMAVGSFVVGIIVSGRRPEPGKD